MELIYQLVALVMAITLHEFAHAWTGDFLGDTTARSAGRLSLNPAAHIDPVMTVLLPVMLILAGSPVIFGAARPVPFNPWALRGGRMGAALVAAAGPLSNFLVASFFALWLRFIPLGLAAAKLFAAIIIINLALGLFNLIPFPPLDGSRILYAFAPYPLRQLMDLIERAGLAAVFILLFIAFPVISPVLGWLIQRILSFLVPGL